jgi:hypothetical protein
MLVLINSRCGVKLLQATPTLCGALQRRRTGTERVDGAVDQWESDGNMHRPLHLGVPHGCLSRSDVLLCLLHLITLPPPLSHQVLEFVRVRAVPRSECLAFKKFSFTLAPLQMKYGCYIRIAHPAPDESCEPRRRVVKS